ncbi:signal peptidase I [Nakamurella sp. GG22]
MRRRAVGLTAGSVLIGTVLIGTVLIGVVVLRTQVLDTVTVSSDSMSPTVCTGDTVLLQRLDRGAGVRVDDIVTFPHPQDGERVIKRVVALAGQSVAIADARLLVDGAVVDEPYVDHSTIDGVYFGPVTVPDGAVFVLGDRRENSIDSRAYGPIPTAALDGRMLWDLTPACGDPG